jgi:hypothetical protein
MKGGDTMEDKTGLLKIAVKLDKDYDFDLGKDLDIKTTQINEMLIGQPSMFAWYGVLAALAKSKANKKYSQLKQLQASKYLYYRDQLGKATEATVDAAIKSDEAYIKLESEYQQSEYEAQVLLIAREAFEQRKDMLISLSSNMRAEMDDDLAILKDKVRDKIANARRATK